MKKMLALLLLALAVGVMSLGATCATNPPADNNNNNNDNNDDNNDNNDDNDDNNDVTTFNIVKTDIALRFDAKLRCGTDLIAFGTGTLTGVSYVVPSTDPVVGTPVPDGENYNSKAFAVGGKNIFLAHINSVPTMFQVSVFNTETETTHTFPATDIRLDGIPVGQSDPGHIRADGDYCAVICDDGEVTDGKVVKVIDASTTPPSLIAFTENPSANIEQLDVDAATKRVVAASTDTLFIYDIDAPATAPVELVIPNGIDATQIEIAGDHLIAFTYDASNYSTAILVDLGATPPAIINLTDGTSNFGMAIGGTKFAFFADFDASDAIGGTQRAAVGTIPGPGFDKAPLDNRIDGSTTNNGTVGFASTMCIVPGGTYQDYVFLAGGWYLQYSQGDASFTVPADPENVDPYATPAWDIDCTCTVVGFKTSGARTDAEALRTLGYIDLQ